MITVSPLGCPLISMKLVALFTLLFAKIAASVLKFKYKSALVSGDIRVVEELLEDAEPWIGFDDATSAECIYLENIFTKSRVLFTEPCRNDPVSLAAGFGHELVLERLLESVRFDPSSYGWFAFKSACTAGHLECSRLLLRRLGDDELLCLGKALGHAAFMGHLEVVRLLIRDKRCEPRKDFPQALVFACRAGHLDVVRLLLCNLKGCMNLLLMALDKAASKEQELIVRLLLKDGRFDDGIPELISKAFRNGWHEIGRLFLAHPSISAFWLDDHPEYLDQGMLIKACKLDAIECIRTILVPITMDDLDLLLRCSISHGHIGSFASYLVVLNSRFEEISGKRAAVWLETIDYCMMFIIRGRTELALDILALLDVPLGDFLDHEGQERDLKIAIRYMKEEGLPNLQRVLELYIRHLALMTIMDGYELKDLWHQIITIQLRHLSEEMNVKFKTQ